MLRLERIFREIACQAVEDDGLRFRAFLVPPLRALAGAGPFAMRREPTGAWAAVP